MNSLDTTPKRRIRLTIKKVDCGQRNELQNNWKEILYYECLALLGLMYEIIDEMDNRALGTNERRVDRRKESR